MSLDVTLNTGAHLGLVTTQHAVTAVSREPALAPLVMLLVIMITMDHSTWPFGPILVLPS